MDPFSIVAGCIGIIAAISQTKICISEFVFNVRDAREELGATARYLGELDLVINLIKNDDGYNNGGPESQIPEPIRTQTTAVINNCQGILGELDALMDKHDPRRHRSALRWALKGKDEVLALNRQLEAHTRTLSMALDISNRAIMRSVKEDTVALGAVSGEIKGDTAQLLRDTEQIIREIDWLKSGLSLRELPSDTRPERLDMIQRYLDSLTTYAETVADSLETDIGGPRHPVSSESQTVLIPHPAELRSNADDLPNNLPDLVSADQVPLSILREVEGLQMEQGSWREGGFEADDHSENRVPESALVPRSILNSIVISPPPVYHNPPPPPPSRKYINPDNPISVFVIGPPGHGKSSFIRHLTELPLPWGEKPTKAALETAVSDRFTVHSIEVSTSKYTIRESGGSEPEAAQIDDPEAPYVKLRLIEAQFDYSLDGIEMVECMGRLLGALTKLAEIDATWSASLHAVTFVHKAGPYTSRNCQRVLRYFQASMRKLFTRLVVVNTHLSTKITKGEALNRLQSARIKEFEALFSTIPDPRHFFIESSHRTGPEEAERNVCSNIEEMLAFWGSSTPMQMSKMILTKTPTMQAIDDVLRDALQLASRLWHKEITAWEKRHAELNGEIDNLEAELRCSAVELKRRNSTSNIKKRRHTKKRDVSNKQTTESWARLSSSSQIFVRQPCDEYDTLWERLKDKQDKLRRHRARGEALEPNEFRAHISARWADELGQEWLPRQKVFDAAERRRYSKVRPGKLTIGDLLEFVRGKGYHDLVEPAKEVLFVQSESQTLVSLWVV